MLTAKPTRGFWCECWTENTEGPEKRPALRASFDAYSAHQADRWVAVALRTLTPALDANAFEQAWTWLYEDRADTRRALLREEPCTITVTQASTRITWTIRSVVFLPLAHRRRQQLPACIDDFRPHPTD